MIATAINSYAKNTKHGKPKISKSSLPDTLNLPDSGFCISLAGCNEKCTQTHIKCLRVHTNQFCAEQINSCTSQVIDFKEKRKELDGFQDMVITSALDGRYFKSGARSFTILGVEYPARKCNLEKGDVVYIVANLTEFTGTNTNNGVAFIKVYSVERDIYCDLM